MLGASDRRQLDEKGWLALPGLMSADLLAALRARIDKLFAEEGEAAGGEFKQEPGARRLANLVNKGRVFEGDCQPARAGVHDARSGAAFQAEQLERSLR